MRMRHIKTPGGLVTPTRHLMTAGGLVIIGAPDPLAGITFALRLQTHTPGSTTPVGLYKDTACTIPALLAGDSVAAWRDELGTSGLVATQSNAVKQPVLAFDDDGFPVLRFDGGDDVLVHTVGVAGSPCTMYALAKRNGGSANYQTIVNACAPNTVLGNQIRARTQASANWGLYLNTAVSSSYSIDGAWRVMASVLRSATDVDLVTDGAVETLAGLGFYPGDANERRVIGAEDAAASTNVFSGDIKAVFITLSTSSIERGTVETYLATL